MVSCSAGVSGSTDSCSKHLHQRQREALHAVAVLANVLALHVVQHLAHLVGRVLVMVEEGNEVGDGALEVDVVLPQRIVGVDQQILAGRDAVLEGHESILTTRL